MNLQHVKYALVVMRHGSINKAAKELYVTQSYLSYCIKELENCLGVKLFKRTSMGSLVTDEGKEFLEMAQPLYIEAESIKEKYNKRILRNKFVIVSTRTVVALKAFEAFFQSIDNTERYELSFFETGLIEVIDQVYYHLADIGIVLHFANEGQFVKEYANEKNLEYHNIDSVPAHITVSKNHEKANCSKISGHEMEFYPCVTYSDFSDVALNLEKECELIRAERPRRLIFVRDRHTLLQMLSNTDAYAVAHKFYYKDNELFNLVSIPVKDATSRICIGYVANKKILYDMGYKGRHKTALIKHLKNTIVKYFK
ncbi:MAG: LysR family transcriptional regulator [Syntrophaceticus sp.]